MNYQLDTNCLLRYLTRDIPAQAKQMHQLVSETSTNQHQLFICEPIFIETAVMLKNYFKFPKDKVASLLIDLLSTPIFDIENHDLLLKATALYEDQPLDFVDCILFIRAQTHNHQIFTFDSKLTNLAQSNS